MKITWSPQALRRASEYADYIAADNRPAAKKWLIKIFKEVKRLEKFPESARIVPELQDETIREIISGNFRVIYQIQKNHIDILTVRRFRQQLDIRELGE